jgi:hypothetical protein
MVKLVIVAIHGIGNPQSDYYDKFQRKLENSLSKQGIGSHDYVFKGIHYSKVFEEEADKISAMTKGFRWKSLRRFVTHSLGDALAYQLGVSTPNRIDFYRIVHDKIDQELRDLVDQNDIDENTPIMFVAHSLGAYIISNYIWDKQREFKDSSKLIEMGSLCGLVTLGCNIPILTLGFDYEKLYPITLPGYAIEDNPQIKWMNVYDKNDPLSIPMEDFYSYENEDQERTLSKIEDIEMNVGNLIVRYTPYSHTKYWNDSEFIDLLREHIIKLLVIF